MSDKQMWEQAGLTREEYDEIVRVLSREPNELELGLYGAMWSEHCSYKNSKRILKRFPTNGPHVLQGPGENAGIVDIGEGLAVAMKIESHNHPSAIEPYHGAATGVGGIIRDIFTMGARPVALLNSLRFGELDDAHIRYLFSGAVAGIASYGNTMGIPTVGGEVYFSDSYADNPLVNAMCVGVLRHDQIVLGKAAGIGNSVMVVGARTGRDGINGASFASEELSEEPTAKQPTVQGDPLIEKRLLEACLELLETGSVVGIQDLGAAGLTSSACETAARAGNGIEVDVALVPRREEGMTPYEVMLSESQERMLVIVEKGREEQVAEAFRKWDLLAVVIGHVTGDGMLRVLDNGKMVGEVPAKSLAEGVPHCERLSQPPEYLKETEIDYDDIPEPKNYNDVLNKLLSSPNIASREWIYTQYDHIGTNTVVAPGSDAAVLRITGTNKGVALTTDCNGRYCYLDPYTGGMIAVAEAARNLVASGAKPLAVTDCLNFGNPEKPGVYYQFEKCVDGMSEMCRTLETPVISGNVSFYNESRDKAVYPTPVVGMLGLVEDMKNVTTVGFKSEGDIIVLVGETKDELGGSEYLKVIHGMENGSPPELVPEMEKKVQDLCLNAITKGLVNSAHDLSEGGMVVALAESCIIGNLGAQIEIIDSGIRTDALLFGESQSRFLLSVSQDNISKLRVLAREIGVSINVLGRVSGDKLTVDVDGVRCLEIGVDEMEEQWQGALECIMTK